MSEIVVTGMGIVSAAGVGQAATSAALRSNRSGLGKLRRFESPRCGDLPVAEVDPQTAPGQAGTPRGLQLAELAVREALAERGMRAALPPSPRLGLSVGTCVGGMPETERALVDQGLSPTANPTLWGQHGCAAITTALADRCGFEGPALTLSTACSSGAQAIAAAADLLRSEVADLVVAGGVDVLCRLTLNGFAALLAVDPDGCRPFDRNRRGMSLGEGAAFLVLERAATSRATALAELLGSGNSCDAHHATAPHPEGAGAAQAIRGALRAAAVEPGEIDYINAHGTGTRDNDCAEGRALRAVFGDAVPALSSTKRVFGHSLGAAGAIEAVTCILAMREGFLPGTAGLDEVDPDCEVTPLRQPTAAQPRTVLSNSFGFGGNNTVLCLRQAGQPS